MNLKRLTISLRKPLRHHLDRPFEWLALEPRRLMSRPHPIVEGGKGESLDIAPAVISSPALPAQHPAVRQAAWTRLSIAPAIKKIASLKTPIAVKSIAANVPLNAVPALNSNPGATATLYLDFTGAAATSWGFYNVPATPAYDIDGDSTTFSTAELSNINQIWARVAEKYSPFNLNVTTVDPGSYADKIAQRIVIGGSGAWLNGVIAGGVGNVGSFYNFNPNTSWVFPNNLGTGNPVYTAEASAHEAGHAFGLQHQSVYSGTTKTNEYNPGTPAAAPTMGLSYYSTRGLWWKGTSVTSSNIQDDMAVLASATDGFGYRPDPHGGTIATAETLLPIGNALSAAGVIDTPTSVDDYKFTTGSGLVTFNLNVAPYGATLDGKLQVLDLTGQMIATADNQATLGQTLSVTLSAGTYVLSVASHGGYGDVGQYTLTGNVPVVVTAPPTGLVATGISSTQISLQWAASPGSIGFKLLRSTDGVNYIQIAANDSSVLSFEDINLTPGTVYVYKAVAVGTGGDSTPSSPVSITTDGNGTGLTGNYFSDETLTTPAFTRVDPRVNFAWGNRSPDPSIPNGGFSVAWTGQVQPKYSETYTFSTNTDDGVRLWVNGQLLVDQWKVIAPLAGDINGDGTVDNLDLNQVLSYKYGTGQTATHDEGDLNGDGFVTFADLNIVLGEYGSTTPPAHFTGSLTLQAGQKYSIVMQYFQHTGLASAQLRWSSGSTPLAAIPQSQLYPLVLPASRVASSLGSPKG